MGGPSSTFAAPSGLFAAMAGQQTDESASTGPLAGCSVAAPMEDAVLITH